MKIPEFHRLTSYICLAHHKVQAVQNLLTMLKQSDVFQRMLAGGIIRNDEMGEVWEVVFRAQRLSPSLNASTTIDEMR